MSNHLKPCIVDFERNEHLFSIASVLTCPLQNVRLWHVGWESSPSLDVIPLRVSRRRLKLLEAVPRNYASCDSSKFVERHET